jgi:hypothetical protein
MKKTLLLIAAAFMAAAGFSPAQAQTTDSIFVAVNPCRLVDTRKGLALPVPSNGNTTFLASGTAPQLFNQGGNQSTGCAAPRPGSVAPTAIAAYIVAVPAGSSVGDGILTAYPSDQAQPPVGTASTVNFQKDVILGNTTNITLCTSGCPAGGTFSILSRNTNEHVVIDVLGYYYPAPKLGYVWADDPASASYTPPAEWAFNSSGGAVTIIRDSTGVYTVTFAGLGSNGDPGGNVQVTKYGAAAGVCHVGGWSSSGADVVVSVYCYDMSGVAADYEYDVLFTEQK